MKKIYLDNCSIQRPLDDQSQLRIRLEAEAVISILSLIDSKKLILILSEISIYEARKAPEMNRKNYAFGVISKSYSIIDVTPTIKERAETLNQNGIKPLDALHLACAESHKVDYFCTSDLDFYKKSKKLSFLTVVMPVELINILEDEPEN